MTTPWMKPLSVLTALTASVFMTAAHAAPRFAYVTDLTGGVTVCNVDATSGQFSNCVDSGGSGDAFTQPGALSFLTLGTTTYAYATSWTTPSGDPSPVYSCVLDRRSGQLSHCAEAVSLPGDVRILSVNFQVANTGVLYAYLGDGNFPGANIWQCSVNLTNGSLEACTPSIESFDNGILMATIETFRLQPYLYVPDGNNGNAGQQLWQCGIDPNTGTVSSVCSDSGAGAIFNGPAAVAFENVSGKAFAYVSNYNAPSVWSCEVDRKTGLFKGATCAVVDAAIGSPNGLQTADIGGSKYLYIVATDTNSVQQCEIQSDGTLGSCVDSGAGAAFSIPFSLTFFP